MKIPSTHPRYHSLKLREKLAKAMRERILVPQGLIAHGRGEAFDYLLGETTIPPALDAIKAGAACMLLAKHPVISVNGNLAVLVPDELIQLGEELNAPLEINLFYRSKPRVEAIKEFLESRGATNLLWDPDRKLPGLDSPRGLVCSQGIYSADTVLIGIEDGDRAQALVNSGKQVIAVDLNPLSRTALSAQISIVDNAVRCYKLLLEYVREYKKRSLEELRSIVEKFNNSRNLALVLSYLSSRLRSLARQKAGKQIEICFP